MVVTGSGNVLRRNQRHLLDRGRARSRIRSFWKHGQSRGLRSFAASPPINSCTTNRTGINPAPFGPPLSGLSRPDLVHIGTGYHVVRLESWLTGTNCYRRRVFVCGVGSPAGDVRILDNGVSGSMERVYLWRCFHESVSHCDIPSMVSPPVYLRHSTRVC